MQNKLGILASIIQDGRLAWRLIRDQRVSDWLKLVPFLSLLYLVSPIDLVPDPILGLGQLDDLGIILLAIKLFLTLCPPELVNEHLEQLRGYAKTSSQAEKGDDEYLDGVHYELKD
ncbi:MAG: DUF1232 domain-containing protein [Chloroflexi bacterium]|nr:DUF1232 domain-containing protein [Chloroflexota bacterium]